MPAPILFMYAIGTIFFMFGFEELEYGDIKTIILLVLSAFTNTMGYFLSYSDPNYVSLAYYPLGLLALTVIFLIYIALKMTPDTEYTDKENF